REIEGFDAEAVAAGDEQVPGSVIEQERELASQLVEAAEAELPVKMDDDLGVTLRFEMVAFRLERASDPFEIVNLAIANEDDIAVFALNRLGAGRQVDDRQSGVRERYSSGRVDKHAVAVRTAVLQHPQHAFVRTVGQHAPDSPKNPAHLNCGDQTWGGNPSDQVHGIPPPLRGEESAHMPVTANYIL